MPERILKRLDKLKKQKISKERGFERMQKTRKTTSRKDNRSKKVPGNKLDKLEANQWSLKWRPRKKQKLDVDRDK